MNDVDRLTEIRVRLDAATAGPWRTQRSMNPHQDDLNMYVVDDRHQLDPISFGYVGNRPESNAEFVAHSRDDIPYLLDQLAEARAAIQRVLNLPPADADTIAQEGWVVGYNTALDTARAALDGEAPDA